MSCCCYKSVPCLLVTSIAVNGSTATLTVPANSLPTAGGRFDLKVSCGVYINPCNTAQIVITDGTTTFSNVLGRCGNYLRLGQIACQVKRGYALHMNATVTPAGNAICLDKLLPAANVAPAAVSCCTSVTITAPTSASASSSTTSAVTRSTL